ncbi:hypothetical protein HT031_002196 [Scenedesmus sp. PABB004]|nr:hypothetical protein HT031_002196 [Scenedesmus sp. PABB004]
MHAARASALVLLALCAAATAQAQLPAGIIPIPDPPAAPVPAALTAAAPPAIAAGYPAAGATAAYPAAAYPAAAAAPAAYPPPPRRRRRPTRPFKPQWDDLKDFTESDVIVSPGGAAGRRGGAQGSGATRGAPHTAAPALTLTPARRPRGVRAQVSFNVANTPEQIFWNQKRVREGMAKAGGILPNALSYYQVLPSTDEFGRPFTTVRFVAQNRNAELASNLLASLNDEKTQTNLKNRIEELNLDIIGDSMKAQTPTDFKAAQRGGTGALPSAAMMDTSGGLNGVAAAGAGAGAAGPGLGGPGLAGPGAPLLPGTAAAGGANSTAGLPGAGSGGMASTLAARRAAANGAGAATAGAAALPLLLAACALLL